MHGVDRRMKIQRLLCLVFGFLLRVPALVEKYFPRWPGIYCETCYTFHIIPVVRNHLLKCTTNRDALRHFRVLKRDINMGHDE